MIFQYRCIYTWIEPGWPITITKKYNRIEIKINNIWRGEKLLQKIYKKEGEINYDRITKKKI